MMEVVWSDEVLRNYFKILDYLFDNWSSSEIENFENNFDNLITRITDNTEICPKSKILNFRKCLIDKNNSLVYQEINGKIFLISLIDNRSSHQY
ncbi:type II toxin-antitoxin system RelE/ParE family toxin [Epilithonimonas ginsengisoli]|uniref:Type II toxin-antitoxin system RelE/ParE family toxin n=1 Tax=Epilithonimonas ginsengisoli TaxID=1245592 RepID=A0ABU4JCJ7_9FLAO|nr:MULTISPECIES: type II toxin-antitoxin system RelE/ParE family toxin [Chryseobacterium group]MBV6878383.1 type II toxin-antitoxin system RelE/ParE family toxin [Epilithonimonas sp. FP105]MDW8547374.1 type II toxin-antitoxin system RelE/ParE family toxin [Epilithonimonas ginsengisoli]